MKNLEFTQSQIRELKAAFDACDIDKNGLISKSELTTILRNSSHFITVGQLDFIFSSIDKDLSGVIDFNEFMEFMKVTKLPENEYEQAKVIFLAFDTNRKKYLSVEDLVNASSKLGVSIDAKTIRDSFEVLDNDGDGRIGFDDFYSFYSLILDLEE